MVFGVTVAWSIHTSGKKAYALLKKEKRRELEQSGGGTLLMESERDPDSLKLDGALPMESVKLTLEEA